MPPVTNQAFETLYNAQYARIYRVCVGYCGNDEEAADLTQEVFIRAWQHWEDFRGDSARSTWLYRIAVNTCLMAQRKRRIRTQPIPTKDIAAEPSETAQREAHIRQLYAHIGQLPETDRLLISMVLEGVPYPDIAQALGLKENTLRVRIHRIKQRLANAFTHEPI